MKSESNSLSEKMRMLGIKIVEKTKAGIKKAKTGIENTLLEDHLRKRFNLENPYKFQIIKDKAKNTIIDELFYRHAKRYEEDDLFVFYGSLAANDLHKGYYIRDLSINADYEIKEVMEVEVPVEYNGKGYEIIGTAVITELV
ncbi:MAG: hypothetical protein PHI01_04230 [Candidatus Izemoplasmatales bacterium]|nr:hypothetical protein [Candidatus Izemoplasmatales bacterium]